jgi:hypothetical protein
MDKSINDYYGTGFERVTVGILALLNGLMLAFLSLMGPLFLDRIVYKTHPLVVNQLLGQDIINIVIMSPLLMIAGICLFCKNRLSKYMLIMTPLYLIYYAISYAIGWEWMAPGYLGNSEKYFFHFVFILTSAFIFLLYSMHTFPRLVKSLFKKSELLIYSIIYAVFLVAFAGMWMKEVFMVFSSGTTRAYEIAPTAFWLVRTFDLGVVIPLGFMSIYLLWIRPERAYPVQYLFYGFFVTQVTAVLAMALMMFMKKDPTFEPISTGIFVILALIVYFGFAYIVRNYRLKTR